MIDSRSITRRVDQQHDQERADQRHATVLGGMTWFSDQGR
jgi:hypothetical protein